MDLIAVEFQLTGLLPIAEDALLDAAVGVDQEDQLLGDALDLSAGHIDHLHERALARACRGAVLGSSGGGVLILISRGSKPGSQEQQEEMKRVLDKHQLQLFPVLVPDTETEDSLGLERLAHGTGGRSYMVSGGQDPGLSVYMDLVDSLRSILQQTLPASTQLVYQRSYRGEGEREEQEQDTFVLDNLVGHETHFNVYFPQFTESYIKSLSVSDSRGKRFSTIMDSTAGLHYYSLYNVPFDAEENTGMMWNYSLVRLPSPTLKNSHVVQVISSPKPGQTQLHVKLFTNLDCYECTVTPNRPVILYAEILLDGQPVRNALLQVRVRGINRAGFPAPGHELQLVDAGTGDPDIAEGGGI